MKGINAFQVALSALVLVVGALPAAAQTQDPEALIAWNAAMMKAEQDKPAEPAPKAPQAQQTTIPNRGNLNNEQEAAPRMDNQALDPKFKGFIPVPNTGVLIKFNAKPRVDVTWDNQNAGDDNRFITAKIPVSTDPLHGGPGVFNINAKGSQLSFEVVAPEVDGSPRFYYQNDFYGSGGGEFPLRVRQLYGKVYNFVVGMTFSVFEDPDVWPDTVDYEGPNSAVFARRPLVRWMLPLSPEWQLNLGVEQPESEVDGSGDPGGASVNHAPDVGANVRWESDFGHIQMAAILRQIGYRGPVFGDQHTIGAGVNLSGVFNLGKSDSLQAQVTFGRGIFRYMNDDFFNNDAALDNNGDLKAIPCAAFMLGFTHRWNEEWRSTVSYGYVNLNPEDSQGPNAYEKTHYVSANAIWQIRKRLNIGFEALYGSKENQAGNHGDAFRLMVGFMYSLFD